MGDPEKRVLPTPNFDLSTPEAMQRSADGWWRTQSATMALLKHAYQQISESEQRITAQEKRIRQLEDLAATDPLTGLMNRRGFEKFFEHEIARIQRKHSPGALLAIADLNLFKSINDTYGHLAGDECLKMVADRLTQSTRMLDGAARLGGDEFAVLLTQIDPAEMPKRLQRLRNALNGLEIEWHGEKIRFGASLGMTIVTAGTPFKDAYQATDTALYADKLQQKKK